MINQLKENVMNTPKICFDRISPRDENRPHRMVMFGGKPRALLVFRKLWLNGSTLKVRFLEGTDTQKATAIEQAGWWSEHANIKFDFNDAANADIRISFDPDDGAWSYLGTDAANYSQSQPTMNLGFLDGGTAAHEFGHALGLAHEHQNPNAGIEWNENVVLDALAGPPNNWPEATARHNVLKKYSTNQIRGTAFDEDSIMLYFFPDSWVKNGEGTKANHVLSETDIEFIKTAYPKESIKVQAVELPIISTSGTMADIGEAGEEDIFKFTVTNEGRHTIETGGQSDVVMKLFGPNSETALIESDDDGGIGKNSKITVDLTLGEYFVQIRHFNRSSGTGQYSIVVKN